MWCTLSLSRQLSAILGSLTLVLAGCSATGSSRGGPSAEDSGRLQNGSSTDPPNDKDADTPGHSSNEGVPVTDTSSWFKEGDYYVAPDGNDNNDGTAHKPWRTIAKAAKTAGPGEVVIVQGGLYRESRITEWQGGAAGAPVIFQAEIGESPTVSTFVELADWRQTDGLWRTEMPWTLSENEADGHESQYTSYRAGLDQVLLDGEMLAQARWPDLPEDRQPWQQLREDWAQVESAKIGHGFKDANDMDRTRVTYSFAAGSLPDVSNWAKVQATVFTGGHWTPLGAEVVSREGDKLHVDILASKSSLEGPYEPRELDRILLWGHPDLISQDGEWARDDASGEIVLQLSPSATPDQHLVEAKGSGLLLHLYGKDQVVFRGLTFQGGSILVQRDGDRPLAGVGFEACTFRYAFHAQAPLNGFHYEMGSNSYALSLHANHSYLVDSAVERTAGTAISASGSDFKLQNTVVRDVGYGGIGGGMRLHGPRANISDCTVVRTGSGAVGLYKGSGGSSVRHCELGQAYRLAVDGGILRFEGDVSGDDGSGTRTVAAYNRIHDSLAPWHEAQGFYGGAGIYLEGGEDRIDIHHNVIWNTTSGCIKMRNLRDVRIVHNSCAEYLNNFTGSLNGTIIQNNLFSWLYEAPNAGSVTNNVVLSQNVGFLGDRPPKHVPGNHYESEPLLRDEFGVDERPAEDSPLVDKALPLGDPELQPATSTAPDIGAWESNDSSYPGRVGANLR